MWQQVQSILPWGRKHLRLEQGCLHPGPQAGSSTRDSDAATGGHSSEAPKPQAAGLALGCCQSGVGVTDWIWLGAAGPETSGGSVCVLGESTLPRPHEGGVAGKQEAPPSSRHVLWGGARWSPGGVALAAF